jgi:hypothetical protein
MKLFAVVAVVLVAFIFIVGNLIVYFILGQ